MPLSVMNAPPGPPVNGAFRANVLVSTGESYVNPRRTVPTAALTVTCAIARAPNPADAVHDRVVAVDHASVRHDVVATVLSCALTVESDAPKFRPERVVSVEPVVAMLEGRKLVTTGASNETDEARVPTIPATVSETWSEPPTLVGGTQDSTDADDQAVVEHGSCARRADAVASE